VTLPSCPEASLSDHDSGGLSLGWIVSPAGINHQQNHHNHHAINHDLSTFFAIKNRVFSSSILKNSARKPK
jgi:hypothetical protein